MDNRGIENLLDEHSRMLPRAAGEADWLERLPEALLTVAPLVLLARELAELLAPVRPRAEFRQGLYGGLTAQARQRPAQPLPMANARQAPRGLATLTAGLERWYPAELDRRWMWGAALGSALSLAGILAYVLHQRGATTTALRGGPAA